ncbi:microtubule-associated protein futsch-like isoform X1 [Teleopsis dalmanni]|uniref:microtubule-associated protein futsch-like isoform X1 n=1 Tax=Teleopsis dalmanni TaxID=139649 RepID=UPI0018CD320A|nr:microtubule-associated protein futsch-like isoform X1 [Teleopsis dalmanni]
MRNLLSSFTRHRHIIHAGYTFSGNGSWILQDGTFSVSDFSEAFQEHEVQRVIRAYADTITMNIHCADAGLWHTLPDKNFARLCRIRINPTDVLDTSNESINAFIDYLAPMVIPTSLRDLLETSDVVGNIRFTHPTLYVFPGGQGDAALFGINGFNMLVDGGFNRKACFWDFARHLDRLDAVLMTRLNNSNIQGLGAVVERKRDSHVYPQIGHFFCNIPDRKGGLPSPDGDKDRDPLLVDLFERGHNLISDLRSLDLKPQNCYRNQEPINLYHKVGHGTLDMYVISPSKDSREVKDFLQRWNSGDQRLFATRESRDFNFPLQNIVSICALLVWQPANPDDTITRILFPGSTPDYKIQEGLEKLKHLEFMKHSTCTAKSIAPTIQTVITTRKTFKSSISGVPLEPVGHAPKIGRFVPVAAAAVAVQQDNKMKEAVSAVITEETKISEKIECGEKVTYGNKEDSIDTDEPAAETGDEGVEQIIETSSKDGEEDNKLTEATEKKVEVIIVKPQPQIESTKEMTDSSDNIKIMKAKKEKSEKPRAEVKPVVRSRIDTKPPKSMERKVIKKDLSADKKSSPTATPRKQESTTTASKVTTRDVKSKVTSRISKSSPSSTPAKSAKEANNRKVLESKQQASRQISTVSRKETSRTVTSNIEKKETKSTQQVQTRKPISRRPRGASPSKKAPGSPIKSAKPKVELKKSRIDKGGTTDSSLVSTPSADEVTAAKKMQDLSASQELDAEKQRELDDLKEEQEVVREIEAVFNRDEMKRQKQLQAGLREVSKQDSTTEAEEEEEYLIIEKEEIDQYTEDSALEQESSITKEEEIQKHQRDSQESEKKRKKSAEEEIEAAIAKVEAEERKARLEGITLAKDVSVNLMESITSKDEYGDSQIPADESKIIAEVQEIILTAKEIVKSRVDEHTGKTEDELLSSPTPEEKLSSAKKTSDTKDDQLEAPDIVPVNLQESLPEEKFSATIESGATTAPTLPEDERIPLDEIKEDLVVEEKYIKEKTKEFEPIAVSSIVQTKAISTTTKIFEEKPGITEGLERVLPIKMTFEAQQNLMRDIVKTPDEVADLPMHEEADLGVYEKDTQETTKTTLQKENFIKEEKEVEDNEKDDSGKLKDIKHIPEHVMIPQTTEMEPLDLVLKVEELHDKDKKEKPSPEIEKVEGVKETSEVKDENVTTAVVIQTDKYISTVADKTPIKKQLGTPEEKEVSDITSEDELPVQQTEPSMLPKQKEHEETVSVESPATIEEAIEVEDDKNIVITNELKEKAAKEKTRITEEISEKKSTLDTFKETKQETVKIISEMKIGDKKNLIQSTKEEKSPVSKEPSRPVSVAESITDKPEQHGSFQDEKVVKEDSRRVSLASTGKPDVEEIPSEKDEKSRVPSKEPSRPESVTESEKREETTADESRRVSTISVDKLEIDKVPSVKDDKSPVASKETSRPVSVAESITDKLEKPDDIQSEKGDKEDSRRVSLASTGKPDVEKIPSEKDEKSPVASKEPSRPESVTEGEKREATTDESRRGSVLQGEKREETTADESRRVSTTGIEMVEIEKVPSVKDDKSPVASKEPSRPASAAESITDKPEKPEDIQSEKGDKEDSRRVSLASTGKPDVEKIPSEKDEKSPVASKEPSRPESVTEGEKREATTDESRRGSVLQGEKREETTADESRRVSTTGIEMVEIEKVPSVKDDKSPVASKEPSRPASAAESITDKPEKPEDIAADKGVKEDSRRVSLASTGRPDVEKILSEKDEKSPVASKEPSRPESVTESEKREETTADESRRVSTIRVDKFEIDKVPSVKDEKSPVASKEPSRPVSAAESITDKSEKPQDIQAEKSVEKDSRRDSLSSTGKPDVEKILSEKDEKSPVASKEPSRPESVTESEKREETTADESRRVSTIRVDKLEIDKVPSVKDDKSPVASKETSRPASVAESIADKSEKPDDIQSEKEVKEDSRRISLASTGKPDVEKIPSEKDEKSPDASKEPSRPESVLEDEKRTETIADESRRVSTISVDKFEIDKVPSVKDDKSPVTSKEPSRPASVAESITDKPEKPEDVQDVKAVKEDSTISVDKVEIDKVPSVKGDKSPIASKEPSRPASAAESITDKPEKPQDIQAEKSVEKDSRRVSLASTDEPDVVKIPSEKYEKSPVASKEPSRPESVTESEKREETTPDESRRLSTTSGDKVEIEKVPSVKDDKSPVASKEPSRPASVAESITDKPEKPEDIQAQKAVADESRRVSLASTGKPDVEKLPSEKDEKSPVASKEPSQPESVTESEKREETTVDESRRLSTISIDKVEIDKVPSVKDEKSPVASKEPSRPASAAGSITDKPEKPEDIAADKGVKEDSRRVSLASTGRPDVEKLPSEKDEKSPDASKEPSRPESVLEDEKRTETIADESRRVSTISVDKFEIDKVPSVKDDKSPVASKEPSRPASVAESITDKSEKPEDTPAEKGVKEDSRRISLASTGKPDDEKIPSEKDEKSPVASKEPSRPESVTEGEKREESTVDESRRVSTISVDKLEIDKIPSVKDDKSPVASKEPSRPASVAESIADNSEKPNDIQAEKAVADDSRRVSLASTGKPDVEKIPSEKDEKSPVASKEPSRPESVTESEKQEETTADESRRVSTTSVHKLEIDKVPSVKDDKSPVASKEPSRPASVAESITDKPEKPEDIQSEKAVEKISSEKDEKSPIASKETSRPESVTEGEKREATTDESRPELVTESEKREQATAVESRLVSTISGDKFEIDKVPSVKDDKSPVASKEPSRPASVAESITDKPEKPEDIQAEKAVADDSRRVSLASTGKPDVEKIPSEKDEKSPVASKELSRPESVTESEKREETTADESRRVSTISIDKVEIDKVPSVKDDKSPVASKETSRPASVAESITDKLEKPDDIQSEKAVKEDSRRVSLASTGKPDIEKIPSGKDEKSPVASKEPSRPESVTEGEKREATTDESRPESVTQDEGREQTAADESRRLSTTTGDKVEIEKVPSVKDDKSPVASKETSRPASVAENITGKPEKADDIQAEKAVADDSRRISLASTGKPDVEKIPSEKDEKSPVASKEPSRPESVTESEKQEETTADESRRVSTISVDKVEIDKVPSVKDDKSPVAPKETSRPASVAESITDKLEKPDDIQSEKGDKEDSRRVSLASTGKPDVEKIPSEKDEKSPVASKEPSRPESVTEGEKREATTDESRPESVTQDERREQTAADESRRVSTISVDKVEIDKVPSVKDDKSPVASKEPSRPTSAAESITDKPEKPEDIEAKKIVEDDSRRVSLASTDKLDVEKIPSEKDEKSPVASKEPSRPESVTESEKREQTTADESRRLSTISADKVEIDKVPSVKDDKSPVASKEPSRPASVAESITDKPEKPEDIQAEKSVEMDSRRVSLASTGKPDVEKIPSEKDEKSPVASKEPSRPESATESEKREETTADESRRVSTISVDKLEIDKVPSVKDDKSPVASKEPSRPASAAESITDKPEKPEDIAADKGVKEDSRRVSLASTGKPDDEKLPSEKDEKSPVASKEPSRPESVTESEKREETIANESHRVSVISIDKVEIDKVPSVKDDKSPVASKEPSRPASVAESITDKPEKPQDIQAEKSVEMDSHRVSLASIGKPVEKLPSEKDEKSPVTSKEPSRPESVTETEKREETTADESRRVSTISVDKVEIDKVPSVKDDKSPVASKEPSRPASVAESITDKPEKPEDIEAKKTVEDDSRRVSLASTGKPDVDKIKSEKDEKSPVASKEPSRPESVTEGERQEVSIAEESRRVSSISVDKFEIDKVPSVKDDKSPVASKEPSRPTSVAESITDKPEEPEDIQDEKSVERGSRRDSLASTGKPDVEKIPSEKDEKSAVVSKEPSRPQSVTESEKREETTAVESRRVSTTSVDNVEIVEVPSVKDGKSPVASKEPSRPASVAESVTDKPEKPEVIQSEKIFEEDSHRVFLDMSAAMSEDTHKISGDDTVILQTLSTPIDEACFDLSNLKLKELSLDLNTSELSQEICTTSSPVDIADKDFKLKEPLCQPSMPSSVLPAELSRVCTSDTVSSPVDEADKLTTVIDAIIDVKASLSKGSNIDLVDSTNKIQDVKASAEVIADMSKKLDDLKDSTSKLTDQSFTHLTDLSTELVEDETVSVTDDLTRELKANISEIIAAASAPHSTKETVLEVVENLWKRSENVTSKISDNFENLKTEIENADIISTEKAKTSSPSKEEVLQPLSQSIDISGYSTELRETHITTVDSPELKVSVCDRDESVLHDIKEEDEEHRSSPPRENILMPQPQRPVSPREEEVAKIVADVAKVLKSEKDITEIIPDFDVKQLEDKLKATDKQTSSACQDGKIDSYFVEEIESEQINITNELEQRQDKDIKTDIESEKSSPDPKSGPISIEEKDKTEESEKVQLKETETKIKTEQPLLKKDIAKEEIINTKNIDSISIIDSNFLSSALDSHTRHLESIVKTISQTDSDIKSEIVLSAEHQLHEKSPSPPRQLSRPDSVTDEKQESLSESMPSVIETVTNTNTFAKSIHSELIDSNSTSDEKLAQHSDSMVEKSKECLTEKTVSKSEELSKSKFETVESVTKAELSEAKTLTELMSSSVTPVVSKIADVKESVNEFLTQEKVVSSKESLTTETKIKSSEESITKTSSSDLYVAKTDDSRRESMLSQTSEGRLTLSDQDDDDDDELTNIRGGRSKSIATIMMTSIYKPSEDVHKIETFEEETEEEGEKTRISKTLTLTKISAAESSKVVTKDHNLSLTQSHEDEAADRKTPPTAPVSPGVKSFTTTGIVSTTTTTVSDAGGSSTTSITGPLSPKDISGRESATDTPESSPKPTSPFPRVTKDDIKASTDLKTESSSSLTETMCEQTVSQTEMKSEVFPELHEIRGIEKTSALSGSTEKVITTTITTVTKVISADGKEIVTEEKTVTTTDSSEPDGEKVTVTTTRTTSESDKSDPILPKEVAMLRGIHRSSTPGSDDVMSDDDMPASPRSVTSSHGASYELQRSSSGISKRSDFDVDDSQDDIPPQYGSEEHSAARSISSYTHKIPDPMSTSFYGTLPDTFDTKPSQPIPIQGKATHTVTTRTLTESLPSQSSGSADSTSQPWIRGQIMSETSSKTGDHKFLEEADLDFEKALEEHVQVRGAEVMSSVTAKYSYSPSKAEEVEQTVASVEKPKFPLSDVQKSKAGETSFSTTKVETSNDGKTTITTTTTVSSTATTDVSATSTSTTETTTISATSASTSGQTKDPLKEWGKPLGLPSPAPITTDGDIRTTPKKERRLVATKTRLNNEKNLRRRAESPNKAKKPAPVYVDLTYVPHNGNSYYSHVEFFKRVRARYYVFSGTEPSRQVYDALLEAKQTWEDKDLEVTIIPTYDTDVLGYWVAENEELLAKYRIDLSPSASRCTINLQDHETSCSAYRLEF